MVNATNVDESQKEKTFFGISDELPIKLPPLANGDTGLSYNPTPKANHTVSDFDLSVVNPSLTVMDWEAQKDVLRPRTISPEAWDAIWQNLKPELGQTLAELFDVLVADADALYDSSGEVVNSLGELLQFEIRKASGEHGRPIPADEIDLDFPAPGLPLAFGRSFGSTISHRYYAGRLGRGWTDNLDIAISEDSTGLVMVRQGGFLSFLLPGQRDLHRLSRRDWLALQNGQRVSASRAEWGADGVPCGRSLGVHPGQHRQSTHSPVQR